MLDYLSIFFSSVCYFNCLISPFVGPTLFADILDLPVLGFFPIVRLTPLFYGLVQFKVVILQFFENCG